MRGVLVVLGVAGVFSATLFLGGAALGVWDTTGATSPISAPSFNDRAVAAGNEPDAGPEPVGHPVQELSGAGRVYFVPVGSFPSRDVRELVGHYRETFSLRVRVLPRLRLPARAFDERRRQVIGEELTAHMRGRFPGLTRDPYAILIALTNRDLYIGTKPWAWVFSLREDHRFVVVSTARMNPAYVGLERDRELLYRRLHKMVTKQIGLLYGDLSESDDPRSVLYHMPYSVDDLDYMTEEFDPAPLTGARRAWVEGADAACAGAEEEAKRLLRASRVTSPEDFLAFARRAVAHERGLLGRLESLPVWGQEARDVLTRLRDSFETDKRMLASLEAIWDEGRLERWLTESTRDSLKFKSRFLELGARGCARYFDPLTYQSEAGGGAPVAARAPAAAAPAA